MASTHYCQISILIRKDYIRSRACDKPYVPRKKQPRKQEITEAAAANVKPDPAAAAKKRTRGATEGRDKRARVGEWKVEEEEKEREREESRMSIVEEGEI